MLSVTRKAYPAEKSRGKKSIFNIQKRTGRLSKKGYKNRFLRSVLILLMMIFWISIGYAGTTGKITGRVTDGETGLPLLGCNILVEGTYQGAATDPNGDYFILNVAPGVYRVRAMMIGYKTMIIEDVVVSLDLTTTHDFVLYSQVLEGEEVIVVAERPLIRKDMTASSSRITASELKAIPLETFQEVIQTQAGIVDGHFRGGRSGETLYMIDGMPATDPFQGNFAANVENEAIQEMEVITGAFNAEYGTAMSGVVNIVTKDGSNQFHGSLNLYAGQWYTTHADVFPNVRRFNPFSIDNVQGSISGAIIKDKLFYYATSRYYREEGRYWGKNIFDPYDGFYKSPNEQQVIVASNMDVLDSLINVIVFNADADSVSFVLASGDSSWVAMNPYEKLNLQTKFTLRLTNKISLRYNIVTENPMNFFRSGSVQPMTYKDFNNGYRYTPDGTLTRESYNYNQTLQLVHQLNSSTFYTLGLNQFNTNYKEYYFDDPNDERYGDLASRSLDLPPNTFNIGGVENHHYNRNTTSLITRCDLTSQVNKRNQVKTGFEIQSHHLMYRDNTFDLTTGAAQGDTLNVRPLQIGIYLQDKIEFQDIIVNAGIRVDYFDPNAKVPADPSDPNIKAPLRSWLAGMTPQELEAVWWKDVNPKVQISPRLGLAYPITDQGVIHISYGHFFQIPNFENLYTNPEWELGNDISAIETMGNPDLEAEQTISYEIGLQQQLGSNIKANIDYYVRDVRGWINKERRVKARDGRLYDQYINSEFASIRGITLQLRRRFDTGYSFSIDYTFQIAEGTGSDPNAGISRLTSGTEIEKQILPLDWDRRHTLNANVVLGNPGNWTASFLMTLGSGLPYNAESRSTPSPFLRNDGRKPFYTNVDFKATKTFRIFGLDHTIYTKINNLFDALNETNVYGDSGRSTYTQVENTFHHGEFGQAINSLREYFNDPSRYSSPMRITFGYQVDF